MAFRTKSSSKAIINLDSYAFTLISMRRLHAISATKNATIYLPDGL